MKISAISLISKEDMARAGDDPKKLADAVAAPVNKFIDEVGRALKGNLTLHENILGFEVERTVVTGVPFQVTPPNQLRVRGLVVIDTGGKTVSGYKLERGQSSVTVTLTFAEGGATQATVRIQFLQG